MLKIEHRHTIAALIAAGLLIAGACVSLAGGPPEGSSAAMVVTKPGRFSSPDALNVRPRTKSKLQPEQRRAQLLLELEGLKIDEQIQELNQQRQKIQDRQRKDQIQRQIELMKLDEKVNEVNQQRKRLQSEHRLRDQKMRDALTEVASKTQELQRKKQQLYAKQRRIQIEAQLKALDAGAPDPHQSGNP
jgi:cobalamin biosynthesis Mg chelatase CobN